VTSGEVTRGELNRLRAAEAAIGVKNRSTGGAETV
jgi:hypothetical protein